MSFARTVLGDVSADHLGICYAHEHVVILGDFMEENFPVLVLNDLDAITSELQVLRNQGVATMVDAMPTDSGRSAEDLVTVSRRTGMNILASTGLHLRLYYPDGHWFDSIDEGVLTERFISEIQYGMVDGGTVSAAKAGVIKVAGSLDRLTELERRNFRCAGQAQVLTGCPILTHTEKGTAALEQVRILQDSGSDLSHVVLSHLDRVSDVGYHREVLSTGVRLEFDSSFRWAAKPNQTQALILDLAPEFPDQLVLGMDAARSAYWQSYGGTPGLTYLIDTFAPSLLRAGLSQELLDRILIKNPADAYAFIARDPQTSHA